VRGKVDQAKGRLKKSVGDLSNDEHLRDEGAGDEITGPVEEESGRGRRKVGEAIKDLGKKVSRTPSRPPSTPAGAAVSVPAQT
jgi:uncharacterized protein YjbJ (UPF0337 family)